MDRSPPRRCGSRSEMSAASRRTPWCRDLRGFRRASSSRWRGRRDRTARCAGRCRPRRNAAVAVVDVGFGRFEHAARRSLAFGDERLDGLDHARGSPSSPSASRPTRSRRSPSPSRHGGARPARPRCQAARPPCGLNTVAWPWPVDCTFRSNGSLSPPGKVMSVPSIGKPPACSSMQEMPRPRYLPRLAASRRRCLKPS